MPKVNTTNHLDTWNHFIENSHWMRKSSNGIKSSACVKIIQNHQIDKYSFCVFLCFNEFVLWTNLFNEISKIGERGKSIRKGCSCCYPKQKESPISMGRWIRNKKPARIKGRSQRPMKNRPPYKEILKERRKILGAQIFLQLLVTIVMW